MRCPVCESPRIVVLVNRHRSAFCTHCGSRWRQQGQRQWSVTTFSTRKAVPRLREVVPPPA